MLISMSTGVPYDISIYTVSIDSYMNKSLRGSFINNHYGDEVSFNSTVEMLFSMEQIMNMTGSPKKYEKDRSFYDNEDENNKFSDEDKNRLVNISDFNEYDKKGDIATFYIKIRFRQNASWQGNITWREGGKTEDFRSVFELLKIIDSVFK